MDDLRLKASGIQGASQLLLDLGAIPERVYKKAGIPLDAIDNVDNYILYRQFLNFLNISAQETGVQEFGLLFSQHQGIGQFGLIGEVMKQSATVGDALNTLLDNFHLYNEGASLDLITEGNYTQVIFNIVEPGQFDTRQQEDLAAGHGINTFRFICGKHWQPNHVMLPHAAPQDLSNYHRLLGKNILFDFEFCGLMFPTALLSQPIEASNQQLLQRLQQALGFEAKMNPLDFEISTKRLITRALLAGDCSIDAVSESLGLNKRTFQRRLAEHNLSYKTLLETIRFDTGAKYLAESNMSLTRISDILCYSDLSAFSRAFKRHFHLAPQHWREQSRQLN